MTQYYDSANIRPPAIAELTELWRYRFLLWQLVTSSIKTRYKRSVLGVFWALLNPLLNTLVLTIAFSQFFKFQIEHFAVYLLCALMFWNFFHQVTTTGLYKLVWGSSLIKRIYIPRTIFAVSVLGNGLVNLGFTFIALLVIMLILGHPITWTVLFFPYAVLVLACFTLGVSLFISTIAVYFADIADLYNVLLSALYFTIPIIYPIEIVPAQIAFFLKLSPLYMFLELFRSYIYYGQLPSPYVFWGATLSGLGMLLIGWVVFTRKVDDFAYHV